MKFPGKFVMKWCRMFLLLLVGFAGVAGGEVMEEGVTFGGTRFRVVRVEPGKLRLMAKAEGERWNSVRSVGRRIRAGGKRLEFAMNAGIFEPGWVPSGLHVEGGRELVALNRGDGEKIEQGGKKVTPNFYLKPTGVFFIDTKGGAGVMETGRFAAATGAGLKVRLATQSGPLMLERGKVHPAFREGSANTRHRNGVGVDAEGRVVCAITADGETVNFFDFAKLFAELGCGDALFLDGDLSVMAVRPEAGKEPAGGLAGILVVVGG